jgi:hypothetical protein
MKVGSVYDFLDGWIVGNFVPSLLKTDQIEVALKRFKAGDQHPCNFQMRSTEVTLVVEGRVELNGIVLGRDEYLRLEPREHASFRALEDSTLVAIKFPSIPDDKVGCSEH